MIDFSGPTQEVEYLARQIALLGRQDFTRGLMNEMADRAKQFVVQEFTDSHDPDGNAWAPTKKPRRGGRVLVKTGKLSRSIRKYVSTASFRLRSQVAYSFFHQNGTRRMVARKILPDGLPAHWATEFEKIAGTAIDKLRDETHGQRAA